jgi:hypothetical protein
MLCVSWSPLGSWPEYRWQQAWSKQPSSKQLGATCVIFYCCGTHGSSPAACVMIPARLQEKAAGTTSGNDAAVQSSWPMWPLASTSYENAWPHAWSRALQLCGLALAAGQRIAATAKGRLQTPAAQQVLSARQGRSAATAHDTTQLFRGAYWTPAGSSGSAGAVCARPLSRRSPRYDPAVQTRLQARHPH